MKAIITFLLLLLLSIPIMAQKQTEKWLKGYVNPDEIVTLSEVMPYNQAIETLSNVSEKLSGKTIVSTYDSNEPIGLQIDKMPYLKALNIIVNYNGLMYEEKPDIIVIKSISDDKSDLSEDIYAPATEREVRISALFFEANISDIKERGINWELLLSQAGISFGSKLRTFGAAEEQDQSSQQATTQQIPPDFTVENETDFTMGDFDGNVLAAFKFFENNQLGELLARPSISVRDKQTGRIQIGSDISIKERDFAGNLIDRFYSTGIIVEATPYIYHENGIDYVLLKLMVERSSAIPDIISTEIQKTTATTEILMLDGEETIIGGLFASEMQTVRRGIPFLKDLPWWVFGIRYLTGYESEREIKKEVIITIKVEIIPTLEERMAQEKENIIQRAIEENEEAFKNYRTKYTKELENEED